MVNNITIRNIEQNEMAQLINLCEAHAHFEKATYDRSGKEKQLSKDILGEHPKVQCLVVVSENELIGYATYTFQYSTWDATDYLYLDCLYLTEKTRGLGIGRKLMEKVKEAASQKNCDMIQWHTPKFNEDAIAFYKRLGAVSKSKERFFWEVG